MKILNLSILLLSILFFIGCGGSSSNNTALNKIVSYATDGTEQPTVQDYLDAGVTGVTEDNINEINIVVAGLTGEDVDTKEEIQALTDSLNISITENIPPIAKASATRTETIPNRSISFSSTLSSDPDGHIVSYQWLENGVTVARVPSFYKSYFKAGKYKIKLIVTDNNGATASDQFTITVTADYDETFTNNTPVPLPDRIDVDIFVDASNAVPTLSKITVTIDILHTYDADLVISLTSPNGSTIVLSSGNNVTGGDNFDNTIFDDSGIPLSSGSAPYRGTFKPDEPLSTFIGENPNGNWTLHIYDRFGADFGILNSWSITVQ